ncbi:MAG: type II toxin-antitoxin system RelE/ParE family toxin [Alphaproteobacteria bacterium]
MSSNRLACTAQAEEDLIEIWSHIALDSIRAADRLLDQLDEKSHMLAEHDLRRLHSPHACGCQERCAVSRRQHAVHTVLDCPIKVLF